ncbi:hypothetical protein FNF29_05507 [Cafeteria roenbergensis]|uniref:YbaK/aminoacyl-tRNA synthetase-associated domain-containing protein n=1 Tax=Cafeteria roenbergensis TaxID=33653 RepID=A0A5A8CBL1_CAFRO|nr:hypothetical protein FNF29_05507 [Cafeteria roenbergensis]|eukprot:KAA0150067.1 hypothetical protein FNF29_05507 [Cafeteria roenbergensis]
MRAVQAKRAAVAPALLRPAAKFSDPAKGALGDATAFPGWNEAATAFALRFSLGGPVGWRRTSGLAAASAPAKGKAARAERVSNPAAAAEKSSKKPAKAPGAAAASDSKPAAAAAAAASSPKPAADEPAEDPALFKRLLAMVEAAGVRHERLTHAPTRTSAESAAVRGVEVSTGAKAMMFKTNLKGAKAEAAEREGAPTHYLVVLSASRQLDLKAVRKITGKSSKMASPSEVFEVSGAVPGAVPPVGSAFTGGRVQTLIDQSLIDQGPTVNFNCGLRSESLCHVPVEDLLRLEPTHRVVDVAVKE